MQGLDLLRKKRDQARALQAELKTLRGRVIVALADLDHEERIEHLDADEFLTAAAAISERLVLLQTVKRDIRALERELANG